MQRQESAAVAPLDFGGATPLDLMPRVFAWEPSGELLERVHEWYLGRMRAEALRAFDEIRGAEANAGRWLRGYFEALPDCAAERFLLAPETHRRIRFTSPESNVRFCVTALMAEHVLSGSHAAGRCCWSALGDYYFAGGRVVDPRVESWDEGESFAAPRVGRAVPLDFASPYGRLNNSLPDCDFEPYTPAEAAALWARVEEGFSNVASVSDAAARLLNRFVKVIIPRKNPLKPESRGTSSASSYVGRLTLRNGHNLDAGGMADGLVHESIHSILFMVETAEYFLPGVRPADEPPVRSPWSNNQLQLKSYLHACFVWYGLAKFWRAALSADTFPPEVVNRFLALALSGFRPSNPVDRLLPYAGLIRPRALEVIGSLRGELEGCGDLDWEP